MSRMSVRTFLVKAKKQLQQALKDHGNAAFVIGNESADLDSITSAIMYGYIQSSTARAQRTHEMFIPVANIPAADLSLRPELTALLRRADVKPADLITLDDLGQNPLPLAKTQWTLADHNAFQGALGKLYAGAVTSVIDHHDDERRVPETAQPRIIEKCGSCSSLVVNHLREAWDDITSASTSIGAANSQGDGVVDDTAYTSTWDAQLAVLALGSILIDTVNLTDNDKVTSHDRKAVNYLEAKIAASPKIGRTYDRHAFYTEINEAKGDISELSLEDILRKDYKQWSEGNLALGISTVVKPVQFLQDKTDDLIRDCRAFAEKHSLQLFAIMTAFADERQTFRRQLLLLALAEGRPVDAFNRFAETARDELGLKICAESEQMPKQDAPQVSCVKMWDQANIAASRKRVAPMLREAIKSVAD